MLEKPPDLSPRSPPDHPPITPPPTTHDPSPQSPTEQVRGVLSNRVHRQHKALIEQLLVDVQHENRVVLIRCVDREHAAAVNTILRPALGVALRDLGYVPGYGLNIVVGAQPSPSPQPASRSPAGCVPPPDWIPSDEWDSLPPMLRMVLSGSTLDNGDVRGANPFQSSALRNYYARDVAALLERLQTQSTGDTTVMDDG